MCTNGTTCTTNNYNKKETIVYWKINEICATEICLTTNSSLPRRVAAHEFVGFSKETINLQINKYEVS